MYTKHSVIWFCIFWGVVRGLASNGSFSGEELDLLERLTPVLDQVSAAINEENYSTALDLSRKAEGISPEDPLMWTQRASIYERMGDVGNAIACMKKALVREPLYMPLVNIYIRQGHLDEAHQVIEAGLSDHRVENERPRANLLIKQGELYIMERDFEAAINALEQAIEIIPDGDLNLTLTAWNLKKEALREMEWVSQFIQAREKIEELQQLKEDHQQSIIPVSGRE